MNTTSPESDKRTIPLLIRSNQWKIAEKTNNQISAVYLESKHTEMLAQLNQKIVLQNQKIDNQNEVIRRQNEKINHLNDLFHSQGDKITELRNSITIKKEENDKQKISGEVVKFSTSSTPKAILMEEWNTDPDDTVFDSSIKRSEISYIFTKNTLKHVPASAWDVSDSRDKSVMAWTEKAEDGKTFILYLAADGDIYANPDSSELFANYNNLTTADFSHLKTDLISDMNSMFHNCINLKQLDVSNWITSNVTDMSFMFNQCEQLASIDVSNWDVSNVTDMNSMFQCCKQLSSIDVSNWITSNVTDMARMFNQCEQLASIDVSCWDVSNVTDMKAMFQCCEQLASIDVSDWITSNVTDMICMFYQCEQLFSIGVSNWDVSNVTNMKGMFYQCKQLSSIDVSNWDVSNVTNIKGMFYQCEQLASIDVSNWDVSNVTNMEGMFTECTAINSMKTGFLSSWNLNPAVTLDYFCDGTKFENNPMDLFITKTSFNSKKAILMTDPAKLLSFSGSTSFGSKVKRKQISSIYTKNTLENIPSTAWDVSASKDGSVMAWTEIDSNSKMYTLYLAADGYIYANPDCNYLFASYLNLTATDFTYLKTDMVKDMSSMFYDCKQLQSLDISHWDVSNVTDMSDMFWNCKQLQSLDISHWDVSNVTDMSDMFWNCKQLQSLDISHWDVSSVSDMHEMFQDCQQLQTLDVSHWDVSSVKNMNGMFSNCMYSNYLTEGALSSWNLNPNVTMYNFCKGTKFGNNPLALFQK